MGRIDDHWPGFRRALTAVSVPRACPQTIAAKYTRRIFNQ
jgi:hypothetical protein